MVPDCINDLEALYGYTKPPIHGWIIRKLIQTLGLKTCLPYLEQIYKPLSRLTEWWYEVRDYDRDGLPQYHHGNDSGWDNATIFDRGGPVEGADLAAYLVLQCETLAFIANTLGKNKSAARWQERADQQLSKLLAHSIKKDRFISPLNGKKDAPRCQSLLNTIPILLGKRLPEKVLSALVADLSPGGPFLTDWGLASEAPKSPLYQADGYWRGPIWAPSTYQIVDGLEDAGQINLARTIAERFCDLCVQHPGFWENYDALSGKGLRCPG
jgi:glycogen debranching enzyme